MSCLASGASSTGAVVKKTVVFPQLHLLRNSLRAAHELRWGFCKGPVHRYRAGGPCPQGHGSHNLVPLLACKEKFVHQVIRPHHHPPTHHHHHNSNRNGNGNGNDNNNSKFSPQEWPCLRVTFRVDGLYDVDQWR